MPIGAPIVPPLSTFPQVICAKLVQKMSLVSFINTGRNRAWLFGLSDVVHLSSSNTDFCFCCSSPGAPQLPLMSFLPETTGEDRILKTSSSLLSSSLLSRRGWTRASPFSFFFDLALWTNRFYAEGRAWVAVRVEEIGMGSWVFRQDESFSEKNPRLSGVSDLPRSKILIALLSDESYAAVHSTEA